MSQKIEVVTQTLTGTGSGAAIGLAYLNALPYVATVAITGTFGGTSAQVESSLDGTNWFTEGAALTSAGTVNLTRIAKFVRVTLTGGAGISLTVTVGY